jgi:hypothetical protein
MSLYRRLMAMGNYKESIAADRSFDRSFEIAANEAEQHVDNTGVQFDSDSMSTKRRGHQKHLISSSGLVSQIERLSNGPDISG